MKKPLETEVFVCLDCETTGLDPKKDRIIEIALVLFDGQEILESYETLVDPQTPIPQESQEIHNISEEMCQGKPKIEEVLPHVFELVKRRTIVGHGIKFDLDIIDESAKRVGLKNLIHHNASIDTLRLARLYGEAAQNSLKHLGEHFNIASMGAHRAMGDVMVNVEVFRHLTHRFKTKDDLFKRLERPIEMKRMPLGKHKGRPFKDVPLDYLKWASHQNFDNDLLYSIRTELKKRKKGNTFHQSTNPFHNL